MKTFSDEEVTAAIEAVVAERGEGYIYDNGRNIHGDAGCYYADADGANPSCIVGFVLKALNPEAFKKVVDHERSHESFDVEDAILYADGEFNVSSEVKAALQRAQDRQDSGKSWGAALDGFKRSLRGDKWGMGY